MDFESIASAIPPPGLVEAQPTATPAPIETFWNGCS
jgi:hypothetical protein